MQNYWVYRELPHPVINISREATIAWYCSLSNNCTVVTTGLQIAQPSKTRLSGIIPIKGRSPNAVVPTVVPTISIHVHHPKSIVQEIPTNRQPVKAFFPGLFQLVDSVRDRLSGQFKLIESTRHQLFRQFQLINNM